ncbi:hypothetical protein ACRU44_04500 [Mycobacterium colombiense]
MTDERPTPEGFAREMALYDVAMATARRYLSALNAGDHQAVNAIIGELARNRDDGMMVRTLMAMTHQCLDFAHCLAALAHHGQPEPVVQRELQAWLDGLALGQLDIAEAAQQAVREQFDE